MEHLHSPGKTREVNEIAKSIAREISSRGAEGGKSRLNGRHTAD